MPPPPAAGFGIGSPSCWKIGGLVPGRVLVGRLGGGRGGRRVRVVGAAQRRMPAVEAAERIRAVELRDVVSEAGVAGGVVFWSSLLERRSVSDRPRFLVRRG